MENRWTLVMDKYDGSMALDTLYGAIASQVRYTLPVQLLEVVDLKEQGNVILAGYGERIKAACSALVEIPQKAEGYGIFVGDNPFCPEKQIIAIVGYDEAGFLYGCMDFCNRYLGDIVYTGRYLWMDVTYDDIFYRPLPHWSCSTAPAIGTRAIWTWGHVIYDYRGFLENMARLRLNEIVIWNDVVPINAKEVVDYAHKLHIKVIWGFAWGWDNRCKDILTDYDDSTRAAIKQQVLDTYNSQYAHTGCDGIYFQSFTELTDENVGGKCVAQLVTALVNEVGEELLAQHPGLHIQFGLHATSVRNQLEIIRQVDKRVHIVWEDCGSFPYEYYADRVADFEDTLAFTQKTLVLRGEEEKWGCVLKGMLNLDWFDEFEHFTAPYILGHRTSAYMRHRLEKKNRIWKLQQAHWLENAEYVRRTVEAIAQGKDAIVQALVEDGMFENKIMLPVALYAEMLWDHSVNTGAMIARVSKYPCVEFANI